MPQSASWVQSGLATLFAARMAPGSRLSEVKLLVFPSRHLVWKFPGSVPCSTGKGMPKAAPSSGTHPRNWLVSFWGQHELTRRAQPALSALPKGATFQTQPSGYQQTEPVSPQSSEQLALVCLQVLADPRNAQDKYYPTQKLPAQPSHIWEEADTQRRVEERPPLVADPGPREDLSQELSFCEQSRLVGNVFQGTGQPVLRESFPLVQTQGHVSR